MSDRPQLSVIVPTTGRDSLERTLRSLLLQRSSLTFNIYVVGDSHAGTWRKGLDEFAQPLVARLRLPQTAVLNPYCEGVYYTEHDGGEHCVGQMQRAHGMEMADGRWLSWLGDDDIYLPGAFEAIRHAIEQAEEECTSDEIMQPDGDVIWYEIGPFPQLFRWISPWKQLYWHTPGFYGEVPGHIDAECIVAPNIPAKLGRWYQVTPDGPHYRYQSDFDFIDSTIKLHNGLVVFRPEIIAQARPSDAEDWTKQVAEVVGAS